MTSDLLSDTRTIYTRLEHTNEIRLLILQPRSNKSNEAVIKCTIEHVKLSNRPQYEALSYMWGSEEDGKIILDDNIVCHVRKNLWLALLYLRLEKTIRCLWIDALCINQLDVNERNHQVTQMGRVYRNAKGVIVWLGASDEASDLAAWALNGELENRLKSGLDVMTVEDSKSLEAIQSLCFREYWERLWIVQEVLMAFDIIIQCGDSVINWKQLSRFLCALGKQRMYCNYQSQKTDLSRARNKIIRSSKDSKAGRLAREWSTRLRDQESQHTLLELCSSFGEGKCQIIQDKVFGLHGLACQCCQKAVPVNYDLSWQALCVLMLKHCMFRHGTGKSSDLTIGVLQQFHERLKITPRACIPITTGRPLYLSFETIPDHSLTSNPADGLNTLHLVGNIRGRISYVSPRFNEDTNLPNIRPPVLSDLLKDQLRYIDYTRLGKNQHPHRTHEIDLVISFGESATYAISAADLVFPNYLSDTNKAIWIPGTKLISNWLQDTEVLFYSLLRYAKCIASETDSNQLRLAFEENGLVLFAPEPALAGDLICQFPMSNLLVVVRKNEVEGKYQLIGRAVDFLASSSTKPFGVCGKGVTYSLDVKECPITFFLDIHTLQLVTLASATPDPASRVPQAMAQTWLPKVHRPKIIEEFRERTEVQTAKANSERRRE